MMGYFYRETLAGRKLVSINPKHIVMLAPWGDDETLVYLSTGIEIVVRSNVQTLTSNINSVNCKPAL